MTPLDKFAKIRPFVKLNIPWNKKLLTATEKSRITTYYNKLERMGYLNREQEGYILKDISRSKYKVKNAPRLKKAVVNVGTRILGGKIETDSRSIIKIRNGKIYVTRAGGGKRWSFDYNIKKDWTKEKFIKHLQKQMGQSKLKRGQYVAIGAGIYEIAGSTKGSMELLANEILKLSNRYSAEYDKKGINKQVSDWMYNINVYDSLDVLKEYMKTGRKKRKKKTGYEKAKGR